MRDAIAGHPALPAILEPLFVARAALRDHVAIIDKRVRDTARQDQVCRRLMTMLGVDPIVALAYRAAVDEPEGFVSSKSVGASFGFTPRRYRFRRDRQSGCISRAGDPSVRVALFAAAHVMLTDRPVVEPQKLGDKARATSRLKRAKVALTRKPLLRSRSHVDGRRRFPLHRICRNHCRVSATELYHLSEYELSPPRDVLVGDDGDERSLDAWECGNATPLWRSILFASRQSHHVTTTMSITNRSMHLHELSKKPLTSTPNDRSRPDHCVP